MNFSTDSPTKNRMQCPWSNEESYVHILIEIHDYRLKLFESVWTVFKSESVKIRGNNLRHSVGVVNT